MGKIATGTGPAVGIGAETIDWKALKDEIVVGLDIAAEYAALGVEFTGAERGSGWRECRAMGRIDRNPSAAVNITSGIYKSNGDGGEVLNLFSFALKYGGGAAGTDWMEVIRHYANRAGVDVPMSRRFGDKGRIEAIYPYVDADGSLLYEVLRYRRDDGSKTFRQRHPDGRGGWVPNIKGIRQVPYRLPDIIQSVGPIWVVEGEKDVDLAALYGLVATSNQQGAYNTKVWGLFAEHFAGREVYIVPDNDDDGRRHAVGVATYLKPVAGVVKIVELPDVPAKGDLSDWFDSGGSVGELFRLADGTPAWEPTAAEEDMSRDATVADLRNLQSSTSWLWPQWIPSASLSILAAEGGTGKTRFCFDLQRRIHNRLPWPDGAPMEVPPGGKILWVVADNQWQEMIDIPPAFDIPDEFVVMNAPASDPYGGTSLQADEELADFEARILRVKPVLVIIDTITNTGDFKTQDASDAKRQYKPLQEIATRCQVPILCVTHLNAGGKVLGRRAVEKVRVVIQMCCPDPEGQPTRRKLWVEKTKALKPQPLGITMGDGGNEYDDNPPETPAPGPERQNGAAHGPLPAKCVECMNWLAQRLTFGRARVSAIRREAEEAGYGTSTLYKAMRQLRVEEQEEGGYKFWELTNNQENGNAHANGAAPF